MVLRIVKSQLDGIKVKEIILKSTWKTYLRHSETYSFILQRFNNRTHGFCTRIFFALETIVKFGSRFLHMFSRLLKIKLKWLKVPT